MAREKDCPLMMTRSLFNYMKFFFISLLCLVNATFYADDIKETNVQIFAIENFTNRNPTDVLIVPYWQKEEGPLLASSLPIDELSSFALPVIESGDFLGKEGEFFTVYPRHGNRIVLLGLGKEEKFSLESMRKSLAGVVKALRSKKIQKYQVLVPSKAGFSESAVSSGICEGIVLASYSFDELKSHVLKEEKRVEISEISLVGVGQEVIEDVTKTLHIVSCINFVRDLVNHNADHIHPEKLGSIAKELEQKLPAIKTTVLNKKAIEKENLGLLLAVSRGSHVDPAFVVLEYEGAPKSKDRTVIIGKGVTYDTGGLNIKPTGGMETMKCDMAGAAAVLGTLKAVAMLNLPVNVVGVIPATENSVGPLSYKPGDVYQSHSGKTVEINNTDCEGRLILADAISYAKQHCAPTRMIDLATLTGAIVIALGEEASGLFSNNDDLSSMLIRAGERSSEKLWRFPTYPEYRELLKSSIADIKNWGGREAGSISAAMFLQDFVGDIPWAHLDIAGTAYLNKPKGYHPTHATGVGVRLLINFLENLP